MPTPRLRITRSRDGRKGELFEHHDTSTRGGVDSKSLGLVRIECSLPMLVLALKKILKWEDEVYEGRTPRGRRYMRGMRSEAYGR